MNSKKTRRPFTLKPLVIGIALTATTSVSLAAPVLEELIITARKDSEGQQTTPIAVTALNQEMLIEKQIVQIADLQRSAPSLAIGTGGTGPVSIIYASIRGQAQNSPNSVTDSAVGIYIDSVYLGRPISSNLGVLDVQQVEVLRGPQGTLFGRNTTGGALNITTNWPESELGGYIKAEVGSYSMRHVEAMVNVPINGSELATRFAYRYNERDGYVENPFYSKDFQDVEDSYSARGSILFSPDELPVEVFFSMDHEYYKDNGTPTTVIAYNDNLDFGFPLGTIDDLFTAAGLDQRDYEQNSSNFDETYGYVPPDTLDPKIATPGNYNRVTGATLDVQFELGDALLKSVTGYRESLTSNQNDLDGGPLDFAAFFSEYSQHQFSQEIQLSGEIGPVQLMGGVYHFEEGGGETSKSHIFGIAGTTVPAVFGLPVSPIPTDYNQNLIEFTAKSQGVFIQGNYDITDELRFTAGYRYTRDQRSVTRKNRSNFIDQTYPIPSFNKPVTCGLSGAELGVTDAQAAALPLISCRAENKASFSYPAYLLSLDYQLNDETFVYIKHSRASMAGSINTRTVPAPNPINVNPETVEDIEVGFKADLWDERIRTNVALFYMEGSDVQRIINAVSATGGLTQYNSNTGDTEIKGLELEVTALLWEGFELNFSGSIMDGEYVSGTFTEDRGVGVGIVDRSDEEIPRLPEFSYSIGATQKFELGFAELTAHLDYSYIDDQYIYTLTGNPGDAQSIADAKFATDNSIIEGYGLLNARVVLNMEDEGLEFAVWGRNITDEEYATNGFESWTGLGFVSQNQGAPMTYGASVKYSF